MNKAVKTYIGKRQYAYVYILHKLFGGNVAEFCRAMRIANTFPKDVQEWNNDFGQKVLNDIEEDLRAASVVRDGDGDIPSVASLKDAMLIRLKILISNTDDPSKLATCYRVLSEFGKDSTKSQSAKGAAQIIRERLKPKGKQMERTEEEREKRRKEIKQMQEEENLIY